MAKKNTEPPAAKRNIRAVVRWVFSTLATAAALVLASHLTYASYELIGRRYVGHCLSTGRVLGVGFVSYAFNLNLGSLVGGVGFRLRYRNARRLFRPSGERCRQTHRFGQCRPAAGDERARHQGGTQR